MSFSKQTMIALLVAAISLSGADISQLAGAAQKESDSITGTVTFHVTPAEADMPERFRLKQHTFDYRLTPQKGWPIRRSLVTFPSPMQTAHKPNNTVHCEYFSPGIPSDKPRPGVIVLHILGGDFELSRLCCRSIAMGGTGALFVKMPYYGPRRDPAHPQLKMISADPHQTVTGMTQAVLDIRRAASWLAAREEIDAEQLGITGISLGGITSALAASIEPRFKKACFMLAGGNFSDAAWDSTELQDVREEWQRKGLSREKVAEITRPIDPVTYAGRLKGRQVLMINAKNDEVIPRACTDALWKAAGKPPIIWHEAGHYSAVFYLPQGIGRMAEFFAAADIKLSQ